MKRLLLAVSMLTLAFGTAHAGEGIVIIDVIRNVGQWWHSLLH